MSPIRGVWVSMSCQGGKKRKGQTVVESHRPAGAGRSEPEGRHIQSSINCKERMVQTCRIHTPARKWQHARTAPPRRRSEEEASDEKGGQVPEAALKQKKENHSRSLSCAVGGPPTSRRRSFAPRGYDLNPTALRTAWPAHSISKSATSG